VATVPGKFFWKLFVGNAALLVLVVATCFWLLLDEFDRFYAEELTRHLTAQGQSLIREIEPRLDRLTEKELDDFAKKAGIPGEEGTQITIALPDGRVIADSVDQTGRVESLANLDEMRQALSTGVGQCTRWSGESFKLMKHVAVRVGAGDDPKAVVRVSLPVTGLVARAMAARRLLLTFACIVLLAAVALALGLARLWTQPIARITATARSLSEGNLAARAPVVGTDEVAQLARSLNRMRDVLARQLKANLRQRRTLEYLLAQLHEGVVVADPDGKIVLINPTAADLLDLAVSFPGGADDIQGLTVEACIPQHELQQMLLPIEEQDATPDDGESWTPASGRGGAGEDGFREHRLSYRRRSGEVTLLARAWNITLPAHDDEDETDDADAGAGADGRRTPGRLLVLTDITELTRSMKIKTDFVANASHELRTPLAAIRGAVETLVSIGEGGDAESRRKLLNIIDRHNRRLEAMVGDLLELSRLESASARFEPHKLRLYELMKDLRERFGERIEAKGQHLATHTPPDQDVVYANPHLLRLVLDNLVDNAVKFTPPGGHVVVTADLDADALCLSVRDDGCGIPLTEQHRVFERFYQVQSARSGPDRGTGLGLAIVRHATAAMDGIVELTSEPSQGATFTVTIPQPTSD